jgi:adenylosuccinate synthase
MPVIEECDAFTEDLGTIKDSAQLPASVIQLLNKIEDAMGCALMGIGTGPKREQFIKIS